MGFRWPSRTANEIDARGTPKTNAKTADGLRTEGRLIGVRDQAKVLDNARNTLNMERREGAREKRSREQRASRACRLAF